MYFSHAFRKTLLGTDPFSPSTNTATVDLTAGKLGLYDSSFAAVTFAAAATAKPFYLVQGSYYKNSGYSDKIGAHGGYQESVKSKLINPKYISRIFWIAGKSPVQQVVQIPLTAASGSTNVGLNAETTYRLRIDVKGSPALRFLSHNIYRVLDSYTGPANVTNPTYLKDPVATLVDWKEQLTMSPYFNQLVQARVYVRQGTIGAATSSGINSWGTPGVSSATLTFNTSNNTYGLVPGQRIIGSGLPANSFVTALAGTTRTATLTGGTATTSTYTVTTGADFTGTITTGMTVTGGGLPVGSYIDQVTTSPSSYRITYPTQAAIPTISGAVTAAPAVTISYPTQATAPSLATTTVFKVYNDVYGANGGYTIPYTNIAATSGQMPTYVGQTPYIPGTSAYNTSGLTQTTGTATLPTGSTITAASTVLASTSGAHIYTPASDAASFSQTAVGTEAILELTAAYLETKFGNPTFTVTDNYDLEPLKIIASLMDDSGNPVASAPIGTAAQPNALSIGVAGIATEVQAAAQAQGTGETVLRELILTGKYRQEAFGDGTNIDQFRMREAEANPGVLSMMTVANRNSLYNKLCILHNVPRFNNPTGVFDNDQYLIEIAVPNTIGLSSFFATTTTSGGKLSTITNSGSSLFGDYIAAAANVANGASGGTISSSAAIIPVEVF